MLIESINLREFRGILRCEKSLNLSDFTVLVGRNNSGKSSILEALALFPKPEYQVPYSGQSRLEFVASLHAGRSSLVYGYSGYASVEYMVDGKRWNLQFDESGRTTEFAIENYDSQTLQTDPFSCIGRELRDRLAQTRPPSVGEKISRMVFFIPNDTSFMNELARLTGEEKSRDMITKGGAHARIAKELINKCVDDKYTEILPFSPQLRVRKERVDGQPLYINVKDLGDGVEKVAIATLWLDAIDPFLVLWDDFEGSAHPTLIRELLRWLSNKKWQVILSTHSIDVLSSLTEVGPKEARVIQLKKTNEDILYHEILTIDELEDILDSSQDPRMIVDSLKL